ncbi:MAG: hypothetical protein AAB777_02635 [Patescibacteria group bacterium]
MKKEKRSNDKLLPQKIEELEARIVELENRPDPNRLIPGFCVCACCGNNPCTCEKSQRLFQRRIGGESSTNNMVKDAIARRHFRK